MDAVLLTREVMVADYDVDDVGKKTNGRLRKDPCPVVPSAVYHPMSSGMYNKKGWSPSQKTFRPDHGERARTLSTDLVSLPLRNMIPKSE